MKINHIVKNISSILHAWDPIGLTPADEYDDLALALFQYLERGYTKAQVSSFVEEYMIDTIGLTDLNKPDMDVAITSILNEYKIYKSI